MADRPGLFVDFDLNETDVTNPSGSEVSDGFAQNDLLPRQVVNRLFSLYGQWTRWLDQTTRELANDLLDPGTNEIYTHTVLPAEFVGNPPVWTGTHSTAIPAGWFRGAITSGGERIGPIDSPVVTLTDERDCYFDLGPDGVWDLTEVPNGDPAPAIAAGHVRFFMFETDVASNIVDATYFRIGFRYVGLGALIRTTAGLMLSGTRGLTFDASSDRSTVIHDGLVEGGNGDIGAITPTTLAAKELLCGRAATVPGGLASNASHWWGLTVNARWTGTQWDRADAASDSYMLVLAEDGVWLLHHAQAQAAPWANTLDPATWVVRARFGHSGARIDETSNIAGVGNINATGAATIGGAVSSASVSASGAVYAGSYLEVDGNAPATMPAESRIYEDTTIRAWGHVITDGAGGIATQTGVGYTASVSGTALRLTWDADFSGANNYAISAMSATANEAFAKYANKLANRCDIHLRTDGGADLDFSGVTPLGITFVVVGEPA